MDKGWGGENFKQNNSGAHLEDEQASSDEEGFPLEQNGHPPATTRNSMYSRIQQEVSSRLPSIDFNAVEVRCVIPCVIDEFVPFASLLFYSFIQK